MHKTPWEGNPLLRAVYHDTNVMRKPITGIVSGYHELPYVLVSPDEEDEGRSICINGKINVSPRFILSADSLGEGFSELFDSETFDASLQGRLFSFVYQRKKSIKLSSEKFEIAPVEESAQGYLDRVLDRLMREENTATALIYGPRFEYYPISIDRFVNEVLEREFRF